MILSALRTSAYRVHQPNWSYTPTSGAGAGTHGGRVNRPGVNALYLSLDAPTALAEYQKTDSLLSPGLIVAYTITVDSIVDFTGGFTSAWDPLWEDFYCDWRRMYFYEDVEPPTWVIGDQVIAAGGKGIKVKSVLTGGTNLVLYNDTLTASDSIAIHDPGNALPKNQDSWR